MDPSLFATILSGGDHQQNSTLTMLSPGYGKPPSRWAPYPQAPAFSSSSSVSATCYQYSPEMDVGFYSGNEAANSTDDGAQYLTWFNGDERSSPGKLLRSTSEGPESPSRRFTPPSQLELRRRRLAANERERKRMNSLNTAFDHLRDVLPSIESGKNLSKIETLLMAQEYIRVLEELVGGK